MTYAEKKENGAVEEFEVKKKEHLDGLKNLPIEERIELLEEWAYNHRIAVSHWKSLYGELKTVLVQHNKKTFIK